MRMARRWQVVLTLASVLWFFALVLLPQPVFPAGHFICHQRADRSFFVNGHQMPVCARCTGLYAGAAIAGPLALIFAVSITSRRSRAILGVAALPTLLTWMLEFAGLVPFSNVSRFVAALPLGFAAAWLVFSVLSESPATQVSPQHP
jgi:uncharacterized membrane protein